MAEVKIDIPGIGEVTANNAASESTLREILKALGGRKMGPTSSGPNPLDESSENTAKTVKKMGDASAYAGQEVETFGDKLGGFVGGVWNLFTAAIGATVGSVVGMGKELIAGGNQLTDFAQHLPIPGLTAMTGLLDNQVNLFRELSTTGAAFGNNMFEITRIAGNAAIPQKDFAELLTTQADSLRLFGSSVQSGARSFAGMSKEMRQGGIGPQLMSMGFSTQELNENLIQYNEMMQVSGRRRYMSDQELVQGAQNYSRELDKISKLTGKSREQLAEELKQKNLDIRRQMAINRLGEEFGLRLQQASEASPALEAALLDMADGVANDPLTQQLMANNETFRAQAQNIQNMSAEQMQNFIRRVADDGMAFANTLGEAGVQASVAGGTATGEMLSMVGTLQRSRETAEGTIDSEQASRDALTTSLTNFSELVNDIRGQIQVAILDSGIFQEMKDNIANFIPSIDEGKEMFNQASTYFKETILPNMTAIGDWLKTKGMEMWTNASTFFSESIMPALTSIWDWLKGDGYTNMKESLQNIWTWLQETAWPKIQETFNYLSGLWDTYGPAIKSFFSDLLSDPKKVWNETVWPALKEGFLGFFADFDWVAAGATLLLALTKLNPFGALASTLIAGVVGFIGWDNIKQFFSTSDLGSAISGAVRGLFDWITGLFDFDFGAMITSIIPDWAKRFLPDSWFSGPSSQVSSSSSAPNPAEIAEAESGGGSPASTTPTTTGSTPSTSSGNNDFAQLNTNTRRMIELLETQNRLLRQMDGNLVG